MSQGKKKNIFQDDGIGGKPPPKNGLFPLGERKDSFIDHEEEWEDKKELYDFLMGDKSMLVNKPKVSSAGNEPFEVAENPGDKDYVPCHLPIQVLFISATYKKRTSLNQTEVPTQ